MKPKALSYAEYVRCVIQAAKRPVPFQEFVHAVAAIRPITSQYPDRTIWSALVECWQIAHTGEGYGYLPYLLKDNVFRIPLISETLRSVTLSLTDEAMCALWPSFFEKGALPFLRGVRSHTRTHAYLDRFVELRTQLTNTKDRATERLGSGGILVKSCIACPSAGCGHHA